MASARALRWQHATAVNLSGEIEIVCCSSETNQSRIGQLALTPHRREERRRRTVVAPTADPALAANRAALGPAYVPPPPPEQRE